MSLGGTFFLFLLLSAIIYTVLKLSAHEKLSKSLEGKKIAKEFI